MIAVSTMRWALLVVLVAIVVIAGVIATRAISPTRVSSADIDLDFTALQRERAESFRRRVRRAGLVSTALAVLVPVVLVCSGVVRRFVEVLHVPWWVQVAAVCTLLAAVGLVITLPSALVIRRACLQTGLATGPWSRWWRDLFLGSAIGWLITTGAMLGWIAVARWSPDYWWLIVAPAFAAAVVLASFVLPVVIEPLFSRFTSLAHGPLRSDLLALADRDRVPVRDVLVADASRRTSALNAYVSGLGPTRRIVVHDTLLDRDRPAEVRAVVAHELGHVVAHDVGLGTILAALSSAAGVVAAAVLLSWPWLLGLGQVSGADDPAVAGLILALGGVAGVLGAPVQSAASRRIERRADEHALELTADPATIAQMHRSLALTNLSALQPPVLLQWWFGTHPTSPERISRARAWAVERGLPAPPALASAD